MTQLCEKYFTLSASDYNMVISGKEVYIDGYEQGINSMW
jgi:hypothetical protein